MATAARTGTLPWSWYADEAVHRLEHERVFRRCWQYAARAEQVAERGQFLATRVGDVPVVLVRGQDERLRGFVNVCRHRGAVVCEGEGRRETLQCPYHAWTYDLDGSLRTAPRADREPGFDADGLGLLPVAVEAWGPFVFANPDPEAAPLAETLGEVPRLLRDGGVDVDALRFDRRTDGKLRANWKVCVENYLECYHCQVAHPGLAKVIDVTPEAYLLDESRWTSSQYSPPRDPGAGGEVARGQFHFVFPNTVINVMPGRPNLSIGPVVPLGPERTYRFLDYFFAPDTPSAWIEEYLEVDDQVGVEDRALVERVQAGVRAGVIEQGRLLPESERLIAHFQALVAQALGA